jgi:hypothetical protein
MKVMIAMFYLFLNLAEMCGFDFAESLVVYSAVGFVPIIGT